MDTLLANITKLHTTSMGKERILRNLNLQDCDVVDVLKKVITNEKSRIERKGKNYYIMLNNWRITVHARSFTIITAHRL